MQLLKLIQLYFYVCEIYEAQLVHQVERFTKNRVSPQFTDAEAITAYLFAVAYEKRTQIKDVYNLIKRHYRSWFPDLPSYQAFNQRINRLNPAFPLIIADLVPRWQALALQSQDLEFVLTDSMPIFTCSSKRQGKVAREVTDKGYNSTKGMHFWGGKLHPLSIAHKGTMPAVEYILISAASEHDLNAQRQILRNNSNRLSFADKAFNDSDLAADFRKNGGRLFIPVKYRKGQSSQYRRWHKAADDLYSKAVSAVRQPIESFFNWLIDKTDLQRASKVRSTKGLLVHIFGRIAAATYLQIDQLNLI